MVEHPEESELSKRWRERLFWKAPWRELLWSPLRWAIGVGVLLVCGSMLLDDSRIWAGFALGSAGLQDEYCELNRMSSAIRQPVNTWSNWFYLWVGFLFFQFFRHDRRYAQVAGAQRNDLLAHPLFSLVFGWCAILLFLGSSLYHASLLYFAQKLDMAGTFAVVCGLFSYAFWRVGRLYFLPSWGEKSDALGFFGLVLGLTLYFNHLWPYAESIPMMAFPMATLGLLLFYRWRTGKRHMWRFMVGAFLLSQVAWLMRELDVQKVWCVPTSMFWQGHAVWHLLTGVGLVGMVIYFRTEGFSPLDEVGFDEEKK